MAEPLLANPVFILSTIRSGSTLLRCLLNSHPHIYAPAELHLRHLRVTPENEYAELAMSTIGHHTTDLEHLLWDRILHGLLTASGKRIIVDKSPSNTTIWRRIASYWPQARYILLHRNPAAIVDSIVRADDGRDQQTALQQVSQAIAELDAAQATLPNTILIRYEDLTAAPTDICQQLCHFLEVDWIPDMLHYGRHDHGPLVYGIGDWSANIRSGTIQPHRLAPAAATPAIAQLCRGWGYAP